MIPAASLFRVLDIAACHIAECDVRFLSESAGGLLADEFDNGWWVYVERDDPHTWLFALKRDGVPESIRTVLSFAVDHDCDWARIWGDGTVYDHLPKYDW